MGFLGRMPWKGTMGGLPVPRFETSGTGLRRAQGTVGATLELALRPGEGAAAARFGLVMACTWLGLWRFKIAKDHENTP
jgi:hypothetical protein